LPYDLRIAPYASCERTLLLEHLEMLEEGDILVLDRGYPSHEFPAKCQDDIELLPSDLCFAHYNHATWHHSLQVAFLHEGRDRKRIQLQIEMLVAPLFVALTH